MIFLDEIDALENSVLISVLRQLRSGYRRRPQGFPQSLALIGLRDVRDYKVKSRGSDRLNTSSPFNIAVRSFTLRDFNKTEVRALLQQHTDETCQLFDEEAIDFLFDLSQGQPWLVNALAKIAVEELESDVSQSVKIDHIEQAKEILVERRQTHLDQLADKLHQPRVRGVIEPIMAGGSIEGVPQDDIRLCIRFGIVSYGGTRFEYRQPDLS